MAVVDRELLGDGELPGDTAALLEAAQRARPVALAREHVLPVLDPLVDVVAGPGLRRGSVVAVTGAVGVRSLALALAAGPSQSGSWVATVGLADLGLLAAQRMGVALERLVVVDAPPASSWGAVVSTLTDAVDVVLLDARRALPVREARRLLARTRERGAVLVVVGGAVTHRWPETADVEVVVEAADWLGLGDGHGFLRARWLRLAATGRRAAVRPRKIDLLLPAPDGGVELVPDGDDVDRCSDHADSDGDGELVAQPKLRAVPDPEPASA